MEWGSMALLGAQADGAGKSSVAPGMEWVEGRGAKGGSSCPQTTGRGAAWEGSPGWGGWRGEGKRGDVNGSKEGFLPTEVG